MLAVETATSPNPPRTSAIRGVREVGQTAHFNLRQLRLKDRHPLAGETAMALRKSGRRGKSRVSVHRLVLARDED